MYIIVMTNNNSNTLLNYVIVNNNIFTKDYVFRSNKIFKYLMSINMHYF